MIWAAIVFSLALLWIGGALWMLSQAPNVSPAVLPISFGLTALSAGWLGIIFGYLIRTVRELSAIGRK